MSDEVLTFEDAVDHSYRPGVQRSVLLGNGFSMAWDADVFGYRSLFDEAPLTGLHVDKKVLFGALGTHDFEKVVEAGNVAAALAEIYGTSDSTLAKRLRQDAEAVRRGLADVVAAKHPASAREITEAQYQAARGFLSYFANIYTVNYDLLTYWAVNHADDDTVVRADGFEWPTFYDRSTLIWKSHVAQETQRVFYLHGALHLFVGDYGGQPRLHKVSYAEGERLVDQIRHRLDEGQYPLIVTEGTSAQKREHIERSAYLRFCRESLRGLKGALFVFGMSLASNDDHIFELIEHEHSGITSLYVGIRGSIDDFVNEEVVARAQRMQRRRRQSQGAPLDLRFYDAASARVWG